MNKSLHNGVFFGLISSAWFRLTCWTLIFTFSGSLAQDNVARAASAAQLPLHMMLPAPGKLLSSSDNFSLPVFKAISLDPEDPFKIDFVIDGQDGASLKGRGREHADTLIKYFLSFLTVPEQDLWVNLSPYEKDRVIPSTLELTHAGRDMLVEDYVLKQLSSSLTYPESRLGGEFWKRVFERARRENGNSDVPVSSFSRVWVVPGPAVVYEENGSAFIAESRLRVMVEQDYLSTRKNTARAASSFGPGKGIDDVSAQVTREIILPELEREVNEGRHFSALRQMYHALILAIWFKKKMQGHMLNQVYADQKRTAGLLLEEKQIREKVYAQYLKAVKKGVYNYVREDYDEALHERVPRKYFSGGFSFADAAMQVSFKPASELPAIRGHIKSLGDRLSRFSVDLEPLGVSKKALLTMIAATFMSLGAAQQAEARDTMPFARPAIEQRVAMPSQAGDIEQLDEFAKMRDWRFKGRTVVDPSVKKPQVIFKAQPVKKWLIQRIFTSSKFEATIFANKKLSEQEAKQIWYAYLRTEMASGHMTLKPAKKFDPQDEITYEEAPPWGYKSAEEPALPIVDLDPLLTSTPSELLLLPALEGGSPQALVPDEPQSPQAEPVAAVAQSDIVDEIMGVLEGQEGINAALENGRWVIPVSNKTVTSAKDKDEIAWSLKNRLSLAFSKKGLSGTAPVRVFFSEGRISIQVAQDMLEGASGLRLVSKKGKALQVALNTAETAAPEQEVARVQEPPVVKSLEPTPTAEPTLAAKDSPRISQTRTADERPTTIEPPAPVTSLAAAPPAAGGPAGGNPPPPDDEPSWTEDLGRGTSSASVVPVALKTAPPVSAVLVQASPAPAGTTGAPNAAPLANTSSTTAGAPYLVDTTLRPTYANGEILARSSGIVEGLDEGRREYRAGEAIFSIVDPDLKNLIDQHKAELEVKKGYLDQLEKADARDQNAVPQSQIDAAKTQISRIEQELSALTQQMRAGDFVTPHDIRITSLRVQNGVTISKGELLFKYSDKQKVVLHLLLPKHITAFTDIRNFTIGDIPVEAINNVKWNISPDGTRADVDMLVETKEGLPDQEARVRLSIFPPEDAADELAAIKGIDETLAPVRVIVENKIEAPSDGDVIFEVKDGDDVKAGKILAVVSPVAYIKELKNARTQLESIDSRLSRAYDAQGRLMIEAELLNELNAKRAALAVEIRTLLDKTRRLAVRSQTSGRVSALASAESLFKEHDRLMSLRPGIAVIGSTDPGVNDLLFDERHQLSAKDPVVVELSSGVRLPAEIIDVNRHPLAVDGTADAKLSIAGKQAVSVRVFDGGHLLNLNQGVRIILPSKEEAEQVIDVITRLKKESADAQQEAQQSAPSDDEIMSMLVPPEPLALTAPTASVQLVALPAGSSQGLSLDEAASRTKGFVLTNGVQRVEWQEAQLNTKGPRDKRLSLSGQMTIQGGKIYYAGGISGMLNNSIGAGITSGNALGAAAPTALSLLGNVTDWITGRVKKEEAALVEKVKVAYHSMEEVERRKVYEAQVYLIEIGAIEQKEAQLTQLLGDLTKARDALKVKVDAKLEPVPKLTDMETKVNDIKAELAKVKADRDRLTVGLNVLMGQSTDQLHRTVKTDLPWDQPFAAPSQDAERTMTSRLTGTASSDPRVQRAIAAASVILKERRVHNIELFPKVSFDTVHINGDPSSQFDLTQGEYFRTSSMFQGTNGGIKIDIPLFDSARKRRGQLLGLENERLSFDQQVVERQVAQEAAEAYGLMRHVSAQLVQAQAAYDAALEAWKLKAERPDQFAVDQYAPERIELTGALVALTDLKKEYLKAQAALRKLGIASGAARTKAPSIIGVRTTQRDARSSDITEPRRFVQPAMYYAPRYSRDYPQYFLASYRPNPVARFVAQPARALEVEANKGSLSAGRVEFPKMEAPSFWIETADKKSADYLQGIIEVLSKDSNRANRQAALEQFLVKYQTDPGFLEATKRILLTTDSSDVISELLKFMQEQKDRDLRFLVSLIDEAVAKDRKILFELAYRNLSDILTSDPKALEGLSQENLLIDSGVFKLTMEQANKVFLSFLMREPDDSIARLRFIRSDYWSTDDKLQIYRWLKEYARTHQQDPDAQKADVLGDILYDEVVRRHGESVVGEIFRLGPFGDLSRISEHFMNSDVRLRVDIQQNELSNRRFLQSSPDWRRMTQYIHPSLAERSVASVEKLSAIKPLSEIPVSFYPQLSAGGYDPMSHFSQLGLQEQSRYIAGAVSMPELARVLELKTGVRMAALNRLMNDAQGRVLALRAYVNGTDEELLKVIESMSPQWITHLRKDIPLLNDPVSMGIVRQATQKLYERTSQEKFLDIRLLTYTPLELFKMEDPRGESIKKDEIRRRAAARAFEVYTYYKDRRIAIYAGHNVVTASEYAEFVNLQRLLAEDDPKAVNAYLEHRVLAVNDSHARVLLKNMIKNRDWFAERISQNKQDVFAIPIFLLGVLVVALGVPLRLLIKHIYHKHWRKKTTYEPLMKFHYFRLSGPQKTEQAEDSYDEEEEAPEDPGAAVKKPEVPNENNPDTDRAMLISFALRNMHEPTVKPLKRWRNLIKSWDIRTGGDVEGMLGDLNMVLNHAEEVIRFMPYTKALMWNQGIDDLNNGPYHRSFTYFVGLSNDTINLIIKMLENNKLTAIQRQRLEQHVSLLMENLEYANNYLRLLSYRQAIEKVMSYKLPDTHWTERWGLYKAVRLAFGYSHLLRKARGEMFELLPKFLDQGNALMPGLYADKDEIIAESKRTLTRVIERGSTSYDPSTWSDRRSMRMGNFYVRFLSLVASMTTLGLGILSLLGFTTILGGSAFSIVGVVGITAAYFTYWYTHVTLSSMDWSEDMDEILRKFNAALVKHIKLSDTPVAQRHEQRIKNIILAHRQEVIQQVNAEMTRETPGVDLIVLVPQEGRNKDLLERYVQSRTAGQQKYIRADVPALVISPRSNLGSGSAYLDIKEELRRRFDRGDFRDYPHLRSMAEANIVILFHGRDASVQDEATQYTFLDLGVTRGYLASKDLENRGGEIIIYSRDAAYGPTPQKPASGISLVTADVDQEDLPSFGYVHVDEERGGVDAVLHGLSIEEMLEQQGKKRRLGPGRILEHLKKNFLLDKPALKQFPVASGMYLIAPDALRVIDRIVEYLKDQGLWERLGLHFTADILIPLIMASENDSRERDRDLDEYLVQRIRWRDMVSKDIKTLQPQLEALYDFIVEAYDEMPFDTRAFVLHPGVSALFHVEGKHTKASLAQLRAFDPEFSSPRKDAAMLVTAKTVRTPSLSAELPSKDRKTGGIDLSDARGGIHFIPGRSGANSFISNRKPLTLMNALTGFSFTISLYEPIHDPESFFLGSSLAKTSWFSPHAANA